MLMTLKMQQGEEIFVQSTIFAYEMTDHVTISTEDISIKHSKLHSDKVTESTWKLACSLLSPALQPFIVWINGVWWLLLPDVTRAW